METVPAMRLCLTKHVSDPKIFSVFSLSVLHFLRNLPMTLSLCRPQKPYHAFNLAKLVYMTPIVLDE